MHYQYLMAIENILKTLGKYNEHVPDNVFLLSIWK